MFENVSKSKISIYFALFASYIGSIYYLSSHFSLGAMGYNFYYLLGTLSNKINEVTMYQWGKPLIYHVNPYICYGVFYSLVLILIVALYANLEQKSISKISGLITHMVFLGVILTVINALEYNIIFYDKMGGFKVPSVSGLVKFAIDPLIIVMGYLLLRLPFILEGKKDKEELKLGTEVIRDPKKAVEHLAKKSRKLGKPGVLIHPKIRIPLVYETGHLLIMAKPGGGKTQVLFPLLEDILSRGDSVMLYDYKGDYTQAYGEDENTIILSPFDSRGIAWDMSKDVYNDALAYEFACQLLPLPQKVDPFFHRAAQDLLTAVIIRLQNEKKLNWNINDLINLLSDQDEVISSCTQYRRGALSSLGELKGKQAAGIFGMLRTGTIQLEYLGRAYKEAKNYISISDWLEKYEQRDSSSLIILKGDQRYPELSQFFISQIFTVLIRKVESMEDSYTRRIWAFLDEFGNLGAIREFDKMLATVRSKGLRVVVSLQDISQIELLYSKAFTQAFFNSFSLLLAGLVTGETASFLSKAFGQSLKRRMLQGESNSIGMQDGMARKNQSENESVVTESTLLDSDFSNIEIPNLKTPATFWFSCPGWSIGKLKYPIKATPKNYPAFELASWLQAKEKDIYCNNPIRDCEDKETDNKEKQKPLQNTFKKYGELFKDVEMEDLD